MGMLASQITSLTIGYCLLNRLFWRKSKKTSKLGVTGLCVVNSPGTGEFPTQMASSADMFPSDDVIMTFCNLYVQYFPQDMQNIMLCFALYMVI